MGWVRDGLDGHEGYVADLLPDGREADGSTGAGVLIQRPTEADLNSGWEQRRYDTGHVDVVVPWDQVVAWRVGCSCGWTGTGRPAVGTDASGSRVCPADLEDEVFLPEWRTHVAPFAALSELGELSTRLRSVELQIVEKVRLARAGGSSWSEIGQAVGLTKQGAQQRWS